MDCLAVGLVDYRLLAETVPLSEDCPLAGIEDCPPLVGSVPFADFLLVGIVPYFAGVADLVVAGQVTAAPFAAAGSCLVEQVLAGSADSVVAAQVPEVPFAAAGSYWVDFVLKPVLAADY